MFPPNNTDTEEEAMMICDYEGISSSRASTASCFERSNSLGNDFCPHSSQLFTLMESDDELPLMSCTIRKQTAVTCLAALAEAPEYEGSSGSGDGGSFAGGVFGTLVAEEEPQDEWGQFAHHESEFSRSARPIRLPSRRKPHQRRRSPVKYDRRLSTLSTNAWRG